MEECETRFLDEYQDVVIIATEYFRLLRNTCAGCTANQESIIVKPALLEQTSVICDVLCHRMLTAGSPTKESDVTCLRCLMQFLGNAVVDFAPGQKRVWNLFKRRLRRCVDLSDTVLSQYTCMVVYNCMSEQTECTEDFVSTDNGLHIVATILELLTTQDVDWGLYILETLLRQATFVGSVYSKLTVKTRDLLLNFVSAQLESGPQSADPSTHHVTCIHEDNLLHLCGLFKSDAYVILRLNQQREDRREVEHLTPELVMCKLAILCSATARPEQFPRLLKDRDLAKISVNLLHTIKLLGEQKENVFTNVEKITQQGALEHTVNPVFGLKRDLIRLLSNMAYRNKENQDQIRELGGIQLILDHTSIDGRNPFITQWAVFAIRNLCDQNMDNQAVIAGMKLEGLSGSVEQLREFGVDVEVQGDKLVVKRVSDATLEQPSPFSVGRSASGEEGV